MGSIIALTTIQFYLALWSTKILSWSTYIHSCKNILKNPLKLLNLLLWESRKVIYIKRKQ